MRRSRQRKCDALGLSGKTAKAPQRNSPSGTTKSNVRSGAVLTWISERCRRLIRILATFLEAFAVANRYEIADDDWFYDAAVKGADAVTNRPGFSAMIDRINKSNGEARTIIVESPDRFARDLIVPQWWLWRVN